MFVQGEYSFQLTLHKLFKTCFRGGPILTLNILIMISKTHICFFTPIPCTYTSLPLDGMARNYHFFYVDIQEQAIRCVWIHFYPTTLYPSKKPFGQPRDQTRLASSTPSSLSILPSPLEHSS